MNEAIRRARITRTRVRRLSLWPILLAAIILTMLTPLTSQQAVGAGPTVVSLTFDDGQATQMNALTVMASHQMPGTFYINSGLVGSSAYYMTWGQVQQVADAGNEIGGHSLDHPDLTQLSTSEAQQEICADRADLQTRGFAAVSFAYPYAASNDSVKQLVQACGYTSGRSVGSLFGPACNGCPYAETIPPADPYFVRTPGPVMDTTTLQDLQTAVTDAETHGGGWVPIVFHAVCSTTCSDSNSVSVQTLQAFLDWLQPRSASGTVVRTVRTVMGGGGGGGADVTPPSTVISCNGAACASGWYTQTVSVSLTATDTGSGVAQTRYTTDGTDPATSATATAYSGPIPIAATATMRFRSVDAAGNSEAARTRIIRIDGAAPAVSLTSPASGSTFRRGVNVTMSASAADAGTGGTSPSGVAAVDLYVDGKRLGSDSTAPYRVVWNTRTYAVGNHVLSAAARDFAGNRGSSPSTNVTILR